MDRQEQTMGDPDIFNFERRLREILHELNLKRALLDDSRRELNEAVLAQHELERKLDEERRDSQETRLQLEQTTSAARRCEEEKNAVMEGLARQRVQLEAVTKERDALRDQARTVQLENLNLKRTVEEQEDQLRCQQAFQESNISCQNKVREAMMEVHSQLQKLEEDHKYLARTVEAANSLSSRLQMNAKHYSCIQEKERQQMRHLEQTVVALRAEVDKLQETQKPATMERSYEDVISSLEATVTEMKARLEAEYEGSNKLNAALAEALKTVSQSQSHEAAASQKALELSEELEKERERAIHLEGDNASLQHQLEILQETLQEERKHHQEVRKMTETPEQTVSEVHKIIEPLEVSQADDAVKELNFKNPYTVNNSEIFQADVIMKDGLNSETPGAVDNNFETCLKQQNLCSMDITPQVNSSEVNDTIGNMSMMLDDVLPIDKNTPVV
ncbi:paramyosin [Anabrus simplex]|uniref:paramyosin n=1 Tax=Anabrus simplex TaxID=316456 RepID=UPI0035A3C4EE